MPKLELYSERRQTRKLEREGFWPKCLFKEAEVGKERESKDKMDQKWLILFKMEYYLFKGLGLVFVLESLSMFLVPFHTRKLHRWARVPFYQIKTTSIMYKSAG